MASRRGPTWKSHSDQSSYCSVPAEPLLTHARDLGMTMRKMLLCHDLLSCSSSGQQVCLEYPLFWDAMKAEISLLPSCERTSLECQKGKKIRFKQTPNTWPFRKFSSQLELCSSFHIILSVFFLLRKISLWWPSSPLAKKEMNSCFCTFCLYSDKKYSDTLSSVITQKYIKHSTHCEEIYTSPSLFLLGICGSMVIYFKWNRSISVLVFFSCLELGSLVQM